MIEQPNLYEAAKQATVELYLNPRDKGQFIQLITKLVIELGKIKWRRCLSVDLIDKVFEKVGEVNSDANDDMPYEWLESAVSRFLILTGLDKDDDRIERAISVVLHQMSFDDRPGISEEDRANFNVTESEIRSVFNEQPLALFLFCLYYSDIRTYL